MLLLCVMISIWLFWGWLYFHLKFESLLHHFLHNRAHFRLAQTIAAILVPLCKYFL